MSGPQKTVPALAPESLAAQALGRVAEPFRDIVPPLHAATTFERAEDGAYPGGRVYSRDASPAYDQAEALLAQLEGGAAAALFASGMAAATAVLQTLHPGQRIVAPKFMYWALRAWLIRFAADWNVELDFYANDDLDDLASRVRAKPTQLLWIETPANPTWEITDIEAAAALGHEVGATVVVDSTVATPVLTRPLALGADIVLHSASKYLNGHADVIAGALVTGAEDERWARIKAVRNLAGAVLGPFEAWLLLRGMRTLFVRVRSACDSASRIAQHLASHPQVAAVLYPGLLDHAGFDTAARQMERPGAMLSVRVKGGEEAARAVAARLRLFKRATSLGSVESLVEHRASIEGPGSFCPTDLLRLSIGLENVVDLLADLDRALDPETSQSVPSAPFAGHHAGRHGEDEP